MFNWVCSNIENSKFLHVTSSDVMLDEGKTIDGVDAIIASILNLTKFELYIYIYVSDETINTHWKLKF